MLSTSPVGWLPAVLALIQVWNRFFKQKLVFCVACNSVFAVIYIFRYEQIEMLWKNMLSFAYMTEVVISVSILYVYKTQWKKADGLLHITAWLFGRGTEYFSFHVHISISTLSHSRPSVTKYTRVDRISNAFFALLHTYWLWLAEENVVLGHLKFTFLMRLII
jgi:hypothetical protein